MIDDQSCNKSKVSCGFGTGIIRQIPNIDVQHVEKHVGSHKSKQNCSRMFDFPKVHVCGVGSVYMSSAYIWLHSRQRLRVVLGLLRKKI